MKSLKYYRELRDFNTNHYIREKTNKISEWFADNRLDAVVIGVSGGVDSALVAALFANDTNLVPCTLLASSDNIQHKPN